MTKFLLLDRLSKILKYAKDNYIRLLIEADPGYTKLYIYVDKIFYTHISKLIIEYGISKHFQLMGIDTPIKWTLTDEKMYYPNLDPELHMLQMEKGDISKTFYNSNVPINTIYKNGILIYLVAIHGKFKSEEIDKIAEQTKDIQVEDLDNIVKNSYIKEYKLNRIGKNRLSIYKY